MLSMLANIEKLGLREGASKQTLRFVEFPRRHGFLRRVIQESTPETVWMLNKLVSELDRITRLIV